MKNPKISYNHLGWTIEKGAKISVRYRYVRECLDLFTEWKDGELTQESRFYNNRDLFHIHAEYLIFEIIRVRDGIVWQMKIDRNI